MAISTATTLLKTIAKIVTVPFELLTWLPASRKNKTSFLLIFFTGRTYVSMGFFQF